MFRLIVTVYGNGLLSIKQGNGRLSNNNNLIAFSKQKINIATKTEMWKVFRTKVPVFEQSYDF